MIGDVKSSERGSGARFNGEKIPYEYLPLHTILEFNRHERHCAIPHILTETMLMLLAKWQSRQDYALDVLIKSLCPNNVLSDYADAARVFKAVTLRKENPYPMWNWAKGMPWSVPLGCAVRHVLAMQNNIELDDDTKLPHRGHLLCNVIMLLHYRNHYQDGDDRPKF